MVLAWREPGKKTTLEYRRPGVVPAWSIAAVDFDSTRFNSLFYDSGWLYFVKNYTVGVVFAPDMKNTFDFSNHWREDEFYSDQSI
jgi:hypothetical protein